MFLGEITPEATPRISALVGILAVLSAARREMSRLTWALLQALVAGLNRPTTRSAAHCSSDRGDGPPAGLSVTPRRRGLMGAGEADSLDLSATGGVSVRQPLVESCEMLLALAPSGRSPARARPAAPTRRRRCSGAGRRRCSKRDELARGRRGVERPFDGSCNGRFGSPARRAPNRRDRREARRRPTAGRPEVVRELRAQLRPWTSPSRDRRGRHRPADTSLGEATRVAARLRGLGGDDQGQPVRCGARRHRQPRRTEHGRCVDADGRGPTRATRVQ
jgi:hypothetical protein